MVVLDIVTLNQLYVNPRGSGAKFDVRIRSLTVNDAERFGEYSKNNTKKYSQIRPQMRLMMFLYIRCMDIQVILPLSSEILVETTHQLLVGHMMAIQFMVHMDIQQEIMFNLELTSEIWIFS